MNNLVKTALVLVLLVAVLESKKVKDPNRHKRQVFHDIKLPQHFGNNDVNAAASDEALLQTEEQLAECKQQKLKPKFTKHNSAYELCKQECKKKRDEDSLDEYVNQLREELKLAEERLVVQKEQLEQTQVNQQQANQNL